MLLVTHSNANYVGTGRICIHKREHFVILAENHVLFHFRHYAESIWEKCAEYNGWEDSIFMAQRMEHLGELRYCTDLSTWSSPKKIMGTEPKTKLTNSNLNMIG